MTQRPFRFSVVAEHAESRDKWLDKAHHIEDLGYTSLLVADHIWIDMDPTVALIETASPIFRGGCGKRIPSIASSKGNQHYQCGK